jgi:myo-inositol-1(or 4)-monophosphatase
MPAPYRAERDAAVTAARRAAQVIRARAGRISAEAVREKDRNDLVTEVDEEAQTLIKHELTSAFPAYEMLSEEEGRLKETAVVPDAPRWIIDPLDGTTNFTFDAPPYAVSIALQHGTDIVVGVVLDVPTDTLYTAVQNGGAYRNGAPVQVSTVDRLTHSLVATGFPFRTPKNIDDYVKVLGAFIGTTRGVRRQGAAAVDLARVACGEYTGFFETGLNPWDVAAGILLIREAGGRVTDFRGEADVLFAGQMVASNGAIHDAIREQVQPIRDMR